MCGTRPKGSKLLEDLLPLQQPQNLKLQTLSMVQSLEQAHAMRIAQGKDMKGKCRWCRKP